jgi:hypothetical protein
MPLALTCECGARFDVDDVLAGQEVPCPECTAMIKASDQAVTPRTSLWALAALTIALLGAFTPGGGLLAVFVGLVALLVIWRKRKLLTGQTVALTAIGIGFCCAVLTAVLFLKPDALPVGAWLRHRAVAGQLEDPKDLKVASRTGDVTLERPSHDWAIMKRGKSNDPTISELQQKSDLLLFNLKRNAYVEVIRDTANSGGLEGYHDQMRIDLNPYVPRFLGDEDAGRGGPGGAAPDTGPAAFTPQFDVNQNGVVGHPIPGPKNAEADFNGREWRATVKRGGQTWRFIIRGYRKRGTRDDKGVAKGPPGPIYVIRAYAPLSKFTPAMEKHLVTLLDTVTLPE